MKKKICIECGNPTVNKETCELCILTENQKTENYEKGDIRVRNNKKYKFDGKVWHLLCIRESFV